MQHPHFCHQAKVVAGPPRFPGTAHAVSVVCPVLFDTTSRTVGRLNEPALGSAHRESNPSEDLSELPPLLAAVAGQNVPL